MNPKTSYSETHASWDALAKRYEDQFMELELYDDTYAKFCDLLQKQNASVLEIGCGPGNITRHLLNIKPEIHILATDVSPNMVALAAKNNPQIDTKVLDCRNLKSIDAQFHGIVCGFTIPYLNKTDCAQMISACHELLHEGGIFYLSFIPGKYKHSGFQSTNDGLRTHIYYYDQASIEAVLMQQQFELVDVFEKEFRKSESTKELHTIIIARKHG